jgi:hypothetical protein
MMTRFERQALGMALTAGLLFLVLAWHLFAAI